ncbi:D-isomer specific 2-hydroxyacid dehydrogenase family protein [Sorangium sp. So ce302]|uniref:NAD(P)-dependent oxidoreductase n=1 Tax=Sorangium sp. So ce302 TaxID=3133297 RepID=UPI003F62A5F0
MAILCPVWPGLRTMLVDRGFELLDQGEGADALVMRSETRLDRDRVRSWSRAGLRLVLRAGTGLDNIDIDACREHGVEVMNFPGINARSVSEIAVAMGLGLLHRLGEGWLAMRVGEANAKSRLLGRTLRSCSIGVIGLGATGRATARAYAALGAMRVVACRRNPMLASEGVELASLRDVLECDVVSVHVPLTPETRHLIGSAILARARRGGVLVNMSRREVVDHDAVRRSLDEELLDGYGSDVLDPALDGELLQHPRVISTPHLGGHSADIQEEIAHAALAAIVAWAARAPR